MRPIKLLAAVTLIGLLTANCTSDDNSPIEVVKPNDFQKELGKELSFTGDYNYSHAGNPIPFTFEKNSIVMKMSEMSGSGTGDDVYDVITVYQNKAGDITKAVAKNRNASEYKAFFFKSISSESLDINIDYTFTTEIEAINVSYPSSAAIPPDHANSKFGWLKLTADTGTAVEINLPVSGKYAFSMMGHGYYYNFTNGVVNFNGDYDMQVLQHNTNTNKILLKGIDDKVADRYYVIQLKNITETTVDINRLTFTGSTGATPESEANTAFASSTELTGNFTTYTKESTETDFNNAFPTLLGTYQTAVVNGIAQYEFKIGNNDEAFLFMADMAGTGSLSESAALTLKRVYADESKGQLIYLITKSSGYYAGRDNQYLTIYAKDINTSGSSATMAIATKNGATSISASKGDVIGKTLDEAKAIAAPSVDAIWKVDMMSYAGVWMNTTRK